MQCTFRWMGLAALSFCLGCGTSNPFSLVPDSTPADFGDLADPSFPTLRYSASSRVAGRTGPRHLDSSQEWIGSSSTTESEARLVDQDQDDGFVRLMQPTINGSDTRIAFATVPITIAAGGDNRVRYLNVAADFNRNGEFRRYPVGNRTQEEWIVVNLVVSIPAGKSDLVSSPYVLVDPRARDGMVCTRATLTTEPIEPSLFTSVGGWDGSGPAEGFLRGETEDHCPTFQRFAWQSRKTGFFTPPMIPELIIRRPPPQQPPVVIPPTQMPPFPQPQPKKFKIPPHPPRGEDPQDDKTPRQEAVFTDVLKRNDYIPRDQGVDVPRAKQGENECVPTSTANSVRYLLNKRKKDEPGAPTAGAESLTAEQLREFFKTAMGTTAADGTEINPASPTAPGFLAGKAAFSQQFRADTGSTGGGLETSYAENPSWQMICDCVSRGEDVEIEIGAYDPATGEEDRLGHMVQVIGCNRLASGELELVLNDPALEDEDSNNGMGTITVPVSNGAPLQSSDSMAQGGLEITHFPVPLENPRTLIIRRLFCEKLLP